MKKYTHITLAAGVSTLVLVVLFQPSIAEGFNIIAARGLTLIGNKAVIKHEGTHSVRVKDSLRVDKSLDVRGNIQLKNGKKVDGVDVSDLAATVDALEIPEGAIELPIDCSEGQVAKYDGDSWECGNDTDTDNDTVYTAGTGISIMNGKINSTITDTNTTYDAGDGLQLVDGEFSMQGTSYDNVIIVAKSGGDYTTIGDALDAITDNSLTNQYVIWVAPGTYEEQVVLKDYVHLIGASRDAVTIQYLSTTLLNGVIHLGIGSILENVTVKSDGSFYSFAVYNLSGSEATLRNVNIIVDPAVFGAGVLSDYQSPTNIYDSEITASSLSYAYGVNIGASMVMENTTITITATTGGSAVYHVGGVGSGVAVIRDSTLSVVSDGSAGNCWTIYLSSENFEYTIYGTKASASACITASYAVGLLASTVEIQNSDLSGATNAVFVDDGFDAYVASSLVDGGSVTTGAGTITCVYSYNDDYAAVNSTCN